jgi:transglutaminase-like putative cysteine protease
VTILNVRHTTVYRYRRPVAIGDHRLMLRPRDSHDLRLIQTNLNLSPPATLRWSHDVFGNSIAIASFAELSAELRIESTLQLETYVVKRPAFQITPEAASYPFIYSADDRIDLGRMLERHHPDPADRLGAWARGFIRSSPTDTLALLADLNNGVAAWISYQSRETEGTQTPIETLNRGWGSCRDLAILLIEAARSLGFGARVVTGYLYNPAADADEPGSGRVSSERSQHQPAKTGVSALMSSDALCAATGAGTTHAWADIYLPGAGWIAYDPTNGTIGGGDLIRVAVTRDISQAVPIAGSFVGAPNDYLGMTVDVSVVSENRGRARIASRS